MAWETKRCPRCKQTLSVRDFGPNKARPDGLQAQCRRCLNGYIGERRAKAEPNKGGTVAAPDLLLVLDRLAGAVNQIYSIAAEVVHHKDARLEIAGTYLAQAEEMLGKQRVPPTPAPGA